MSWHPVLIGQRHELLASPGAPGAWGQGRGDGAGSRRPPPPPRAAVSGCQEEQGWRGVSWQLPAGAPLGRGARGL